MTPNIDQKLTGPDGAPSSTHEPISSHSSSTTESVAVGPETAPVTSPKSNNIVICEEDSDDGSLFRSFTVWRSNFSVFGDATRLRRAANTRNAAASPSSLVVREPRTSQTTNPTDDDDDDNDAARERNSPARPPSSRLPSGVHPSYLLNAIPESPGLLVSRSRVPAQLINKDTVILIRPTSPADILMLTQSSGAGGSAAGGILTVTNTETTTTTTTTTTIQSDFPPRRTFSSKFSKNNRSQRVAPSRVLKNSGFADLLAIGEEGESKCSTVRVRQDQSNTSKFQHLKAQNDPDGNENDDASSSKQASGLEMGSFYEQPYFLRDLALSDNRDGDDDDMDSWFFTRTGAPDSKFRQYSLDVDPTNGDRAVDLYLCSWARPHMRGFHLAWMSFFVAFFTWFAMTPLLSEIARSLDFTHKEIFTSSVLALVSSAITRLWIGPLNDMYGARWIMSLTLLAAAIPTALAGLLLQDRTSLYILRFFIGVAGSSFVTCQYWTVSMFTKEIAGTANALAAGWGNLGGGVAQVVMGSLVFPLIRMAYGGKCFGKCHHAPSDDEDDLEYDRPSDLAWRTALLFPALLCCIMAVVVVRYGDDTPKGNAKYRRGGVQNTSRAPLEFPLVSIWGNLKKAASNFNAILLFLQYGACFGVEIAMTQAAALYFIDEFGQSTESAGAIASIFGWMNIFARGLGGFCSDWAFSKSGFRGRLWCQLIFLVSEGLLIILFSYASTLGGAVAVMIFFSIFLQAAEGSTFGIVPYVDEVVTGAVVGFVGAGGIAGGAIFACIFVYQNYQRSFFWMGCAVVACAFLSPLVRVPGHCNLLGGTDDHFTLERRQIAKPPAIIFIPTPSTSGTEEGDTIAVDDEAPSTTFTM